VYRATGFSCQFARLVELVRYNRTGVSVHFCGFIHALKVCSIFVFQDEKNQIIHTNIWLNVVMLFSLFFTLSNFDASLSYTEI